MSHNRLCALELIVRELLTDEMSTELPQTAKPQAALLISKVYFYMNIQEEAVEFALLAGSAFQQEQEGEYRETIIGKSSFRHKSPPRFRESFVEERDTDRCLPGIGSRCDCTRPD